MKKISSSRLLGFSLAILSFNAFITANGQTTSSLADRPVALGLCLENYEYPYPVHYITLNIQNEALEMAYMDVEPGHANGHTVVLLHGKNFCAAYWGQTARVLAENGYRVILPDQVGFGKSSKPHSIQYSFQLLARNTKAILDSLGIGKVAILGHSMGGMLATRFALMYPGSVEKFILEDPIGLEDWKLKVPYQPVEAWYNSELKQTPASLKKYMLDNYFHGTWDPSYDQWVNIIAGWTLSPEYARMAWNSALTYDMIFTQPVCYEFPAIQAPTLLIIGQLDRTAIGKGLVSDEVKKTLGNYPELGKKTHAAIKNSRLVELENVGHVPHVEAFQSFIVPLLDFLKS
ncbi:MAG: alpha/beta hydrolase [Puia sp.]|nr:alpha/beta hydrolase [Puia sp.]